MCQFICKYCRGFFFLSDISISSCSCEQKVKILWETIFSSSSRETPNRILPNLAHLLIVCVFTSVLCGVNKEVKENNNNKKPNPILAFLAITDHVSYCHHWRPSSSSVRRPSYLVNFFKNLLLWNYLTNWNQTWPESSLGCLVSKLCPMMPCTHQHGRCY